VVGETIEGCELVGHVEWQGILGNATQFSHHHAPALIVGQSPWTAADAPVGLLAFCRVLISLFRPRDEGVPRRPGGLPQTLQHSRYWENYVALGHFGSNWRRRVEDFNIPCKLAICCIGMFDFSTSIYILNRIISSFFLET
jgi:hypothetical protein